MQWSCYLNIHPRTAQLLVSDASDLANALSKIAENELKRRNTYRSEAGGRLPWDIKGMDATPDHLELEVRKSQGDILPDITRSDVVDLFDLFNAWIKEMDAKQLDLDERLAHPMTEARDVLQRQMQQLDSLEADFEKLVSTAGVGKLPPPRPCRVFIKTVLLLQRRMVPLQALATTKPIRQRSVCYNKNFNRSAMTTPKSENGFNKNSLSYKTISRLLVPMQSTL